MIVRVSPGCASNFVLANSVATSYGVCGLLPLTAPSRTATTVRVTNGIIVLILDEMTVDLDLWVERTLSDIGCIIRPSFPFVGEFRCDWPPCLLLCAGLALGDAARLAACDDAVDLTEVTDLGDLALAIGDLIGLGLVEREEGGGTSAGSTGAGPGINLVAFREHMTTAPGNMALPFLSSSQDGTRSRPHFEQTCSRSDECRVDRQKLSSRWESDTMCRKRYRLFKL